MQEESDDVEIGGWFVFANDAPLRLFRTRSGLPGCGRNGQLSTVEHLCGCYVVRMYCTESANDM